LNFYIEGHRNATPVPGREPTMNQHVSPSQRITEEVTSWEGVTAGFGNRGEFAFKLRGREIGHLHGDRAAHFFFAKQLWSKLKAAGRIEEHPVFPDHEGPAARRIRSPADVDDVIALMRLNYDAILARAGQPA
jgi:hypothetical protein